MDINLIIRFAFLVLSAFVTYILKPWVEANIEETKRKKIMGYTRVAVEAAEQIFDISGAGLDKMNYALGFLKKMNLGLDEDQLKTIVESVVKELYNSDFCILETTGEEFAE